jgi:methyl-accepting chemotaxis protein
MGVTSIISYTKSKNALSDTLHNSIQEQTKSTANILKSWIQDRKLDLDSWRHEEIYTKAAKDTFVGKAARVSANKTFDRLKKAYGYYEDLFLTDLTGEVIASSAEDSIKKINIGDREYFKAAMNGDAFVSDVMKSRNSGNPIFVIAAPVIQKDSVVGVLAGVVDISIFSSKFIDPIKVGKSGFAYLYGPDGTVYAHPDRSYILDLNINKFDFGRIMLKQGSGLLKYNHNGESKWVAYSRLEEYGWTVAINEPVAEIMAPVISLGRINLIVVLIVAFVAIAIIYVLTSTVVRPINQVVAGLKDVAEGEGDLTKRINVSSQDEVGELAFWFNTFIGKIQQIISDVTKNAANLSVSARELADISNHLSDGADQTSGKALTVSSASEEMSVSISSVAGIMEETANNLAVVASGAEEMTATISEIAHNTEKGRQIAEEAVSQTSHASEQIEQLGNAAQQIGKVVETITEISEQVNLLALNATIEAARAGDAGKGFAVVANEIKDLAKQTATASGEIKQQVVGIQSSTQGTVAEIVSIATVVAKVSEIVTTIATAVEEQSVTTRDIAGNVAKASEGVSEVNRSISESAETSNTITADIADVTQASGEISNSSSQVNSSSNQLSELAETLNAMVGQFKV